MTTIDSTTHYTPLYGSTLDSQFMRFHRENPHVYERLVEMAKQAKAVGRRKIGMKMLFEVLRWEHIFSTTDPDFKLNNNYTARYARLVMDDHPELEGIFDLRSLRS